MTRKGRCEDCGRVVPKAHLLGWVKQPGEPGDLAVGSYVEHAVCGGCFRGRVAVGEVSRRLLGEVDDAFA